MTNHIDIDALERQAKFGGFSPRQTIRAVLALIERVRAAEVEVKELREENSRAWKQSGAARRAFDEQYALREKAEAELARLRQQEPVANFIIIDSEYQQLPKNYSESPDAIPLYAEPRPAVLLNKDAIREVFMRNGFTIKEGQSDLKEYVYAAANELLALGCQSQRVVVKLAAGELVYSSANDSYGAEGCVMLPVSMVVEAIKAAGGEVEE